jgi:hypothetical protein
MTMQTNPRRTNGHDTVIELRVDDGWAVEDLQTCEECDEARLVLTETIARIEEQLLEAKQKLGATGEYANGEWYRRAKTALRYKKAALQAVQNRQAQIRRAQKQDAQQTRDRMLLDLIREKYPEQFKAACELFQLLHPELRQI